MLPSLFISHGSPMLALQPGASGPALAGLARALPRPKAIVVVSAHWESRELLVTGNAQPRTWHDFGGFPPALYAVQYPAPGEPGLARRIAGLLGAQLDEQRPFDHGAWVPLSLMYPAADIPVVQVSLPSQSGPALQLEVGAALATLRQEGILLIGSGSITHNLGELDWACRSGFDRALGTGVSRLGGGKRLQADDRAALLDYRQQAPYAVRNHPSDEHLLPLFFAMGAGERIGIVHQGFTLGALGMDIYRFD